MTLYFLSCWMSPHFGLFFAINHQCTLLDPPYVFSDMSGSNFPLWLFKKDTACLSFSIKSLKNYWKKEECFMAWQLHFSFFEFFLSVDFNGSKSGKQSDGTGKVLSAAYTEGNFLSLQKFTVMEKKKITAKATLAFHLNLTDNSEVHDYTFLPMKGAYWYPLATY